jgi:O-succinylbenzoate synthase
MKIEAITVREIQMPLVHFFETSFGRTTGRRIVLVTVQGEGITAWGECVAGEHPHYCEECVETAWYAITKELSPLLLGKELKKPGDCVGMMAGIRGNRMAKAALENALWAAEAIKQQVPLWKLLGGTKKEIVCGVSIGIQNSPEELEEKVAIELAAGYQRIKLKCKPGWDLKIFERIRKRWPNITLSCDANSAYTLADTDHLKEFDQFKLLMIEQPLWHDDFYFHAELQKKIKTKICLDEAMRNARDAEAAIALGSCGIVNIKVGRVGGMTDAIKVHDVCQKKGIPVWCGGMLESGIGRAHNVALSTLPNFSLPGDVSASARYWKEDVIEPEVTVSKNGTIAISDAAGTGYKVREDLIEKLTVRKERLAPAAVAMKG